MSTETNDGTDSTDSFKDSIDTTNTNIAKPQSKSSNQQYVVPFGIVIVLFTLYLTTSALKRTLDFNETQTDDEIEQIRELQGIQEELMTPTRWQEDMRRKFIIEKLLEHTDKCYDLAIFTKEKLDCTEAEKANMELAMVQIGSMEQETGQETEKDIFKNDKESTLVMDATQQLSRRDSNNARNARKKDAANKKDTTKKGATTAEPIIYLFALVFIYLLLKAASDINQHYKAQSKGDKRLRRCSLQSYAQTHKPDRRASKEFPIIIKHHPRHHHMMEARSKSVDRYSAVRSREQMTRKHEILAHLRKYTSMDEPQQNVGFGTPTWNYITANNSPILMTPTSAVDAEQVFAQLAPTSTQALRSLQNRRCSVPVSLNYQRHKLSSTPAVALSSTCRRTSIASGSIANLFGGTTTDTMDAQFPEIKRRVRMINRH